MNIMIVDWGNRYTAHPMTTNFKMELFLEIEKMGDISRITYKLFPYDKVNFPYGIIGQDQFHELYSNNPEIKEEDFSGWKRV